MKMIVDLLYHHMCMSYDVSKLGRNLLSQEIAFPEFYVKGEALRDGKVYVTRTQDLPQICSASCVFVCVGNRPARFMSSWRGMVLYIENRDADLMTVLNHLVRFIDEIYRWDISMRELLERSAGVEELVRRSIPIFNNCITITDYSLRILVNCDLVGEGHSQRIEIVNNFDRVPDTVSRMVQERFAQSALRREPFYIKGQLENPEGENYCINLYLGNTYFGTCTLWEKLHPLHERDLLLFGRFAEFIRRALSSQSGTSGTQVATLKSIFTDLLRSFPVSSADLEWAVDLVEKNMKLQGITPGSWRCVVIKSANKHKALPEGYLCTSIENMFSQCTAVALDGFIVCFCMIPEGENCEDTVCDIMAPYLRDMNFRASISESFTDLFKVRDYYLQAAAILETGLQYAPEQFIYRFSDYILPYMLRHSMGEFDMDFLITDGLRNLMEADSGVDYWDTLKRYLENECNASKTAQDLYLHRSSLLPRLEKIRSLVDLDTPENRLYLRMCICLHDMEQVRRERN